MLCFTCIFVGRDSEIDRRAFQSPWRETLMEKNKILATGDFLEMFGNGVPQIPPTR